MVIRIGIRDTDLTESVRAYVERRLRFALGRFANQLGCVTVRISDLNGPRGGVDKVCRISAELIRSGRLVLQETVDANLYAAIDRAANRVGRSCSNELQRLRQRDTGMRSIRTGMNHSAALETRRVP